MTCLIVRHTQGYLVAYSIFLVTRTGTEKTLERRQITTLACTLGLLALSTIGLLASPSLSLALEKYGRPLPSMEQPDDVAAREAEETLFGGYFLTSAFVSNPTFAARPDNSGLVGLRHMLHLETDLYKQYLTFYTDQNFFSDRTKGWIELSEWDGTYAFTGLIDRWGWRLQYERDAPLDKSGLIQAYADALLTSRFQAIQDFSWWQRTFPNQNLTAYAGAGWLFHNGNYFARPDNTGRALFRYVAHADLDLYQDKVVFYADANMFTDRSASNSARPSELDWILGLALRWRDTELSVYREQDQPLDRPGLVQKYWAVQLRVSFDVPKRFAK
ncbi:MAG: hypothetical protein KGS09_17030 [Nitrospirae bacterium]|nr:hypothetical protein [Nitrospirota bacterium]MDE3042788.1 hypothetical protein [Nitrospirota bacterium]MDE3218131.1 hypothetical protein [Nitrospirota bacterium]